MRRRNTVSAYVRSSTGECFDDSSEMKRISPMMDETGARKGLPTPDGSDPDTVLSFSVTVWRARRMSCPHSNSPR